ncbi:transporter substrate-binding domain-containing protein [Ornithinibacillus gellani]|uniref:transporter substrate-binding domain-containing protein n=1 Tax=Ornithinibacillus gellani TaxID=2293253 RepID=UPI000F4AE8EA|nr:transporter substrate-binding domain-containing protein [Ornithinibacillus gellani]TQS76272.1 transporter substrate-binding domain-containing protein [Ornithinibacillus gellani]
MKKLLLFLIVLLLGFAAGCGENGKDKDVAGASGKKIIRVGATPDGFPTSYKEDGEMKGFSADIIKAIIKEAGYEIEWVLTDWNGVLANLQSGKIDTASNFAATAERGKDYQFTDPYYSSKAVIATAENNTTLKTIEDTNGKQIASIMGTNFENVLKEHYPDVEYELITYESSDVVYTDVASGKVEGFVFGREQIMAQISKKGLPLRIVAEPFGSQPVAMPFKKTKENDVLISDLNQAAKALKKNGRFSEISMEYFGVDLLEDEE